MVGTRIVLVALAVLTFACTPTAYAASELSILPSGELSVKRLTVLQLAGKNLFARANWGTAFIRVTVLVNDSTKITKSHGDPGVLSDLKVGDVLDVDGTLSSSAESIIVGATAIRNTSADVAQKSVSGKIISVNGSALTMVVSDSTLGQVTVAVPASVPITKGARSIEFSDIGAGDRVVSASGMYDYQSNTFTANTLEIYQDSTVFLPRNFQGTLKSISGKALPVSMVVTVDGVDYTVYFDQKATVLKKDKSAATLARFVAGDTVRFWGAIRKTNLTEVDGEIVRDLNF